MPATTKPAAWRDIAIDELRPHPRNYREHTDDQLDHIARSIELHGVYRNVVAARDLTLLAGHGVVLAAKRMGLLTIPVGVLDVDPFDTRALQLLAGDNEVGHLADVDDRALGDLLRDLANDDIGNLLSTGFDDASLSALLMVTRPSSELRDLLAEDEWLGLPSFEPDAERTPQITIKFVSTDDRDRFVELCGLTQWAKRFGEQWSTWWPERGPADRDALRFE